MVYEDKNINMLLLERYPAKLLARVLVKKLGRKLQVTFGGKTTYEKPIQRAIMYNGIVVYDKSNLNGEGPTIGQDYLRALLELGLKRCERIFEFCAGPGYIGYSLLANGFCDKLTLADINPEAVAVARKTAHASRIEHLVNIYQSDCLDQIPAQERWDLVVSNPPYFIPRGPEDTNIKAYDPGWSIHRRFYNKVKQFMKPGGLVVMMENSKGSEADIFKPMIEAGGGKFVTWRPGIDVCGKNNFMYYVVSQW